MRIFRALCASVSIHWGIAGGNSVLAGIRLHEIRLRDSHLSDKRRSVLTKNQKKDTVSAAGDRILMLGDLCQEIAIPGSPAMEGW